MQQRIPLALGDIYDPEMFLQLVLDSSPTSQCCTLTANGSLFKSLNCIASLEGTQGTFELRPVIYIVNTEYIK